MSAHDYKGICEVPPNNDFLKKVTIRKIIRNVIHTLITLTMVLFSQTVIFYFLDKTYERTNDIVFSSAAQTNENKIAAERAEVVESYLESFKRNLFEGDEKQNNGIQVYQEVNIDIIDDLREKLEEKKLLNMPTDHFVSTADYLWFGFEDRENFLTLTAYLPAPPQMLMRRKDLSFGDDWQSHISYSVKSDALSKIYDHNGRRLPPDKLRGLALNELAQGNADASAIIYKEVHAFLVMRNGEDSEYTLTTRNDLGYALMKAGFIEIAKGVVQEVYEKRKGKATLHYAAYNLAEIYELLHDYKEAVKYCEESYKQRFDRFGPNNSRVIKTNQKLKKLKKMAQEEHSETTL